MIEILNDYLVQHKSIGIPGIGTLYAEQAAAQSDEENRVLMPPGFAYRFDKFQDTPLKEFFPFVAGQLEVAEYEAIRLYNEFAASLRSEIRQNDLAVWQDIGVFRKNDGGEISFEQFPKRFSLFDPIDLLQWSDPKMGEKVGTTAPQEETVLADIPEYRDNLEAQETRKQNRWWIWLLVVLALLAAAATGLHLYTQGAIWQQLFH